MRSHEKMEKNYRHQALTGLLANFALGIGVYISSWAMRQNWKEMGLPTLPPATTLSLDYGLLIPVASAFYFAVAVIKPKLITRFGLWVLVTELVLLAGYMVGITMPTMSITYRLGP